MSLLATLSKRNLKTQNVFTCGTLRELELEVLSAESYYK